jgi:hypothetical protein
MNPTLLRRAALALACCAVAAACADSTSAPANAPAAVPGQPAPVRTRFDCVGDLRSRTLSCAAPAPAGGPRTDVILGQQRVNTKLTSSNLSVSADTFAFDVAVTNLLRVPIGTTDGTTPDPDGVRVFFASGVATTQGTGTVDVANADGVGVFTASGQPYFAYHEIVQPDSTSSPRRWKLRFDPGVQTFSFTVYVNAPLPPGNGSVHMTVLSPRADTVVGQSLAVRVRVDSASASVASIDASAGGRTVVLQAVSPGLVGGTLDLSGLPAQRLELRVHAVTVFGDTGVATVPFVKNEPPTLSVTSPHAGQVTSGTARVDVECSDDSPTGCRSVTVSATPEGGTPQQLASGTTSIHTTVDVSGYEGKQVVYTFEGTDSLNFVARVQVGPTYVESSSALVLLDSAGSEVLDADSTRTLYIGPGGLWMRDRVAGTRDSAVVPISRIMGRLHPQGAIVIDGNTFGHVYDWRLGALQDLGMANSSKSLHVAGSWAIWNQGTTLFRRDLLSGSTITVDTAAGNINNDVAPNGDVVWWSGTGADAYDIYRYRAGAVTRITADPDAVHRNTYPVTDGTNILYFKSNPGNDVLFAGGAESILAGPFASANPHSFYEANAGWIAWVYSDAAGALQIRTRSPGGIERAATFSATSSVIHALGPDGTLVFTRGGSLYAVRAPYSAAPVRLSKNPAWAAFRGSRLLVFLGNSVFDAVY